MAKRTRKQKQRAVVRRPAGTPTASAAVADAPADTGAASVSASLSPATDPALRRRVERVTSPAIAAPVGRRPQRGQPSGFIQPLESDDAAIPFDRVPYVPADLRRVAIIATVMIMLIIVADIVVSNVVK